MADLIELQIETGYPSGLPPMLDMSDEEQEALDRAIRRINKKRKRSRKGR